MMVREGPVGQQPLLTVRDLAVRYGQIEALHGVSLDVCRGEIVALIGSNGAGKTTTLRAISGMLRPARGRVELAGRDITGRPAHEVMRLGLAHVPEGRQLFGDQSVYDNLLLGAASRPAREAHARAKRELARFPVLIERQHQRAGTLSGGEQQMLAIARGLVSQPSLLLLDEPSMGLAPLIVRQVAQTIVDLNAQGVTILLVEQLATLALAIADRAYVIQDGLVKLEGSSASVARNPDVVRAYLGGVAGHESALAMGQAQL